MSHRIGKKGIVVWAVALLAIAVIAPLGCASKKPVVLLEATGDDGFEADDIMGAPTTAVDDEQAVAELPIGRDPRVDQLEADVAKLQVEGTKVREQVAALTGRVDRVETTLNATQQQVSQRFNNFDAELARVREAVSAAKSTAEAKPARDMEGEVAMAVDAWRQSWQQADLNGYMRKYHANAQILRINVANGGKLAERRLTTGQLRTRMAQLIRQYARMEVIVRDFRVASDSNRMIATFEQEFSAWSRPRDLRPRYSDRGIKTLVFVQNGGTWQIISESWSPLRK